MSLNPFAALLGSSEEGQVSGSDSPFVELFSEEKKVNKAIEDVFGFTINNNRSDNSVLVYLEDFSKDENLLDLQVLGQALFERLTLENPSEYVIPKNGHIDAQYVDKRVLVYLFYCYNRLKNYDCDARVRSEMKCCIVQNAVLLLQQPIVFLEQDSPDQMIELMKDVETMCDDFFEEISVNYMGEDGTPFDKAFKPVLKAVHIETSRSTLLGIDAHVFRTLEVFTMNDKYANVLLDYCMPDATTGRVNYSDTLFGALLSISILPKTMNQRYEYFDSPMDMTTNIVENNLWHCTANLTEKIHYVFMRLLRLKETKAKTLKWIAQCVKANSNRGKLWNTHMFNPLSLNNSSDAFMINLSTLLLRLCQPICANLSDQKILKIDPTYCAVIDEEREKKHVSMLGLSTETCLIPVENEEKRPTAETYTFVTECFFMTHKTLDISFRICVEQLIQLNQELSQIQRSYNDALQQGVGGVNDILETIRNRMEEGFKKYRSIRATLIEPNFLTLMSQFHKATAAWLVQVSLCSQNENNNYAPLKFRKITFPFPEIVPNTLK